VFTLKGEEARFIEAGRFVDRALPRQALIVTEAESGSIRYYSGRPTVGWRTLDPDRFDETLDDLRKAGFEPFILLEAGEDGPFRERFARASALGRLDWPPAAEIRTLVRVRIYDPAARARHFAGERVQSEIFWPSDRARQGAR
jgi:hypothetical protein